MTLHGGLGYWFISGGGKNNESSFLNGCDKRGEPSSGILVQSKYGKSLSKKYIIEELNFLCRYKTYICEA